MHLHPNSKFFTTDLPKSVWEWHKSWFYVQGLGDDLPAFVNEPPRRLRSWAPLTRLSPEAQVLADTTARLKESGPMGGHIIRTWVERCVLPLQARLFLMYKYMGPADPMRVSKDELGSEEVETHLSFLTRPKVIEDSKVTAM